MTEASCKVFFALRPPPEIANRVDRLRGEVQARLGSRGRTPPAHRMHVSLASLGTHPFIPEGRIVRARAAAASLQWPPFTLAFNRLGGWGRGVGARAVVLWGDEGVIGAEQLHTGLWAALAGAGVARAGPLEINPHMTLWRDLEDAPEQMLSPIAWRVRDFVLLAAIRGQSHHVVLGRWALAG